MFLDRSCQQLGFWLIPYVVKLTIKISYLISMLSHRFSLYWVRGNIIWGFLSHPRSFSYQIKDTNVYIHNKN